MLRKHEAAALLGQDLSPAEIAARMGVSIETVMGYLYNQVGEGTIRRSDILFSIGDDTRAAVHAIEQEHGKLERWEFRRAIKYQYPDVD
jgi:predicted transcriptional regulator